MKAWAGLNFNQIRQLTTELLALERLQNQCICFEHSSAFIFDWAFFILAGNEDNDFEI